MTHPSDDSVFVRACRGLPTPFVPVWLMRQAGRYMEEYRELRARVSFLELCRDPSLVAETTVFAQERIGADAAIVFSDLLLILMPMGLGLDYIKGKGPQLTGAVRTGADVDRIRVADPESLSYVYEGVRATRAGLQPGVPLIGFCGAPFTLASYACEGGGSKQYVHTKSLMYRDPGAWHALMGKLVDSLSGYLIAQIDAGCQVVQVFDSWIGALGPEDYIEFAQPHSARLIAAVKEARPDVPLIHFGTGSGQLLELMQAAGGDVIGVDFQTRLGEARVRLGAEQPVQGNLDPLVLYADGEFVDTRTQRVLDDNGGRPGFVFNLGHGILPQTPVDNVVRLIDYVHRATS
jgi:uroporphyrinogen decarboxylase